MVLSGRRHEGCCGYVWLQSTESSLWCLLARCAFVHRCVCTVACSWVGCYVLLWVLHIAFDFSVHVLVFVLCSLCVARVCLGFSLVLQ